MKGIYLIKQGRADQAFEISKMQLAETQSIIIALLNLKP
jgi:hypothetical protein